MKITLPKESLARLIQSVMGAVGKSGTSPILENVLIKADGGEISVTATDMELESVSTIETTGIEREGQCTVNAKKLSSIINAAEKDTLLSLNFKDNKTALTGARNRFNLASLPADEFPELGKSIIFDSEVTLPESLLKQHIALTEIAMANQDVRYYLNGMLFDLSGNNLTLVATDGHRLSVSQCQCEYSEDAKQIIVPRKGVAELNKVLANTDNPITLKLSRNHIRIEKENLCFTSKLIDGRYPDYHGAIPANYTTELMLNKEQLKNTLQRVAILSNEKFRGMRMTLKQGVMVLESQNPEHEIATEEVDIEYSGDDFEIGFNINYLLDAVKTCQTEDIKLCLTDANSSALLHDSESDETKHVVMPIKL